MEPFRFEIILKKKERKKEITNKISFFSVVSFYMQREIKYILFISSYSHTNIDHGLEGKTLEEIMRIEEKTSS